MTKTRQGAPVKERDSQRQKLYLAELVLKDFSKPVSSIADVERLVARVWGSKRVQESWPAAFKPDWLRSPYVKDGRGCRVARGGSSSITIPLWARTEYIVLHELAHTLTRRQFGVYVAGHGWQFCAVYLRLVLLFMGRAAHDALKASFKERRVRFRPKRQVVISTERRLELAARLREARGQPREVWRHEPDPRFTAIGEELD